MLKMLFFRSTSTIWSGKNLFNKKNIAILRANFVTKT